MQNLNANIIQINQNLCNDVVCTYRTSSHHSVIPLAGNEVDQGFSIIARELKSEDLYTVDDVKKRILGAPINPKPICEELEFTYAWKEFISPILADPQLSHHTRYNSFSITNENNLGVLR